MSPQRILKSRPHLPQWQALLLLVVFLSARGLVPAGFMPAAFADSTPYGLCHGDSRSALLLNALAIPVEEHHHGPQTETSGHNHDALTAHSFADNHCNFSAAASLASAPAAELYAAVAGNILPTPAIGFSPVHSHRHARPLIRAPPV
ncbi:hypothetical protein [uncultured Microbulbifer sp.]|uniref:hypothetical protein n=1 Tax=uncultured Microbulbifer sp. TaxID=348147 RepID=UPI002610DC11|nr:hypothetical protein [uncultured Microbulbifer sp.]